MEETIYRYEFKAQVQSYIRQVLGQRPHDEVRPVIDILDIGRVTQDQARETGNALGSAALPAPTKLREQAESVERQRA